MVAEALPHVEAVIIVTDNATSFSYNLHGYDITVASDMRFYRQHLALAPLLANATLAKKVFNAVLTRFKRGFTPL